MVDIAVPAWFSSRPLGKEDGSKTNYHSESSALACDWLSIRCREPWVAQAAGRFFCMALRRRYVLLGRDLHNLRFLVVGRWVFSHRAPTWKKLWQYHVANALGFGTWWGVANLLKAAGVHYMLAAVLAMFFSVGFNLLSNFLWIWRTPAAVSVDKKS